MEHTTKITAQEAVTTHLAGDLDKAEQQYLALLKEEEDNPSVANNLAYLLIQKKEYERAFKMYEQLVAKNPAHHNAFTNWGIGLALQGEHTKALEKLDAAIRLKEDHVQAWENKAKVHFYLGDLVSSYKAWEIVVELAPQRSEFQIELANVLLLLKQPKQALMWLKSLRVDMPDYYRVHHLYGVAMMQQKNYGLAIQAYRTAIGLNPSHYLARLDLAAAYTYANELKLAIRELELAQKLFPQEPKAFVECGVLYLAQAAPEKCIELMNKALIINANIAKALYYKALAMKESNFPNEKIMIVVQELENCTNGETYRAKVKHFIK